MRLLFFEKEELDCLTMFGRVGYKEKETLASVVQAIFDGLTLQYMSQARYHEMYHAQMNTGIDWLLEGIRVQKERNDG